MAEIGGQLTHPRDVRLKIFTVAAHSEAHQHGHRELDSWNRKKGINSRYADFKSIFLKMAE